VRDWCQDGLYFAGQVSNVKLVENSFHHNRGRGVAFQAAPSGTVQVYGNSFRDNGAEGLSLASGAMQAGYNEWGDIAGPDGPEGDGLAGEVDPWPWVFGRLYLSPSSQDVGAGERLEAAVRMDVHHLFGLQFELQFDPNRLRLISQPEFGSFYVPGEGRVCTVTEMSEANLSGEILVKCNRADGDPEYDAAQDPLLALEFQAALFSGSPQTSALDLVDSSARLASKDGAGIFIDSLADGTVTIRGAWRVNGAVDLQGRADDSGAVVKFPPGTDYPGGKATTDALGRYEFWGVTPGGYRVKVEMERYLDAASEVVTGEASRTLNTVRLPGGDADDSDAINIRDASAIGGAYGTAPGEPRWFAGADINNDRAVDLLDLVLMGGNYGLRSPVPWTP
jgi:hypothetical protein